MLAMERGVGQILHMDRCKKLPKWRLESVKIKGKNADVLNFTVFEGFRGLC